jgi:hypothetical protein
MGLRDTINSMTERARQRWATIRAIGKWRYVLFVGVFYWGQLCFVITCIVLPAFYREPDESFTPARLLLKLAIWLVLGFVFGLTLWSMNERALERHQPNGFPIFPVDRQRKPDATPAPAEQ